MKLWLKSAIVAMLTVAGATLMLPTEYRLDPETTNDTENREIKVSPSSSLKLLFCLNFKEINKSGRCHVSWHFKPSGKNQTELDIEKKISNWTESVCDLINICKPYILSNINESNVGWYHCKVTAEIPRLEEIISSKIKVVLENLMEKTTVQSQTTKTQVKVNEEHDRDDNWWMWIFIGVSSVILIVIALLVICAAQKRLCNRNIGEEPIYVNTPVKPSPRLMPAPDNLKTVSSSQNLRTPNSAPRYEKGYKNWGSRGPQRPTD